MAQTFVYNLGTHQKTNSKTIHLEFGLFFDGTRNNMEHTKIRKKVNHKGEFRSEEPTVEEKNL